MEGLSTEQRLKVSKMSDERLSKKLVQAGYKEGDILKLDRPILLDTYANVLLVETAYVATGGVSEDEDGGDGETVPETEDQEQTVVVGGSLEERRLWLEQQKLQEQRLQRQMEEKRWQEEREERKKQFELEQKKLEIDEKKWHEEMQLKRSEQAHRDSTAVNIKNWGDALRNTITRMPNESMEIVSWFIGIERLYDQLKVPSELQAVLIRPYLSDQAKVLMSKCDVTHSSNYQAMKKFLLQELHLSPSVYLEKFNTLSYDKNDTYSQYSSKLMSLYNNYVESRTVGKNYEKLLDLIVYDRMKNSLPPSLLRHVLSLEAAHKDGWLGRLGLVEALDAYMANM